MLLVQMNSMPFFVLLDLKMRGLDGLDLLRHEYGYEDIANLLRWQGAKE